MTQIVQAGDRWLLQGDIDIHTVNGLLLTSQKFPMSATTVADFNDVRNIDTTAISLILEWKRRAKRENTMLTLANMPENLKSLTALYGVSDIVN